RNRNRRYHGKASPPNEESRSPPDQAHARGVREEAPASASAAREGPLRGEGTEASAPSPQGRGGHARGGSEASASSPQGPQGGSLARSEEAPRECGQEGLGQAASQGHRAPASPPGERGGLLRGGSAPSPPRSSRCDRCAPPSSAPRAPRSRDVRHG